MQIQYVNRADCRLIVDFDFTVNCFVSSIMFSKLAVVIHNYFFGGKHLLTSRSTHEFQMNW